MKRIDWKNIFTNKYTLAALAGAVIAFIYQILGIIGIVPTVTESDVTNCAGLLINILVGLGIITDSSTPGIGNKDEEAKG